MIFFGEDQGNQKAAFVFLTRCIVHPCTLKLPPLTPDNLAQPIIEGLLTVAESGVCSR